MLALVAARENELFVAAASDKAIHQLFVTSGAEAADLTRAPKYIFSPIAAFAKDRACLALPARKTKRLAR
jgi:hypothetical protein